MGLVPCRVLKEGAKHLAAGLEERVAGDDLEEPLQSFAALLDNIVSEPVCEHLTVRIQFVKFLAYLARERRDSDARAFALQNVAECLEVRVSPADN